MPPLFVCCTMICILGFMAWCQSIVTLYPTCTVTYGGTATQCTNPCCIDAAAECGTMSWGGTVAVAPQHMSKTLCSKVI